MSELSDNLSRLRERVEAACRRSGRAPESARIMAVTKTQSRERVLEAYGAGIRLFGENRVGEAAEKYQGMPSDLDLHMIGHLQRNKASRIVGLVSCVESIDKLETAQALDRLCAARGSTLEVMIEVNTSGEGSKNGYTDRDALLRDIDEVARLANLRLTGLMTIAPFGQDIEAVRASFRSLFLLREEIGRRFPGLSLHELSMGMSEDFETAIEEGSTLVRIGTALFGRREAA